MKVSKCRKFGDLILKTEAQVRFLKTENLNRECIAGLPQSLKILESPGIGKGKFQAQESP